MLLEEKPRVSKGKSHKYWVRCDWKRCRVEFLHGHKYGPHMCPKHRPIHTKIVGRKSCKTYFEKSDVKQRRKAKWNGVNNPTCPVCHYLIGAQLDCPCPKEVELDTEGPLRI
jgi:hypothetical protein